jgi:hypothetical protein
MDTCFSCSNKIIKEEASYFQSTKDTFSWNKDLKNVWTYQIGICGGKQFFYCSEYCLCNNQINSYMKK